eukprot:1440761-Prymnesium_polylepis.1
MSCRHIHAQTHSHGAPLAPPRADLAADDARFSARGPHLADVVARCAGHVGDVDAEVLTRHLIQRHVEVDAQHLVDQLVDDERRRRRDRHVVLQLKEEEDDHEE